MAILAEVIVDRDVDLGPHSGLPRLARAGSARGCRKVRSRTWPVRRRSSEVTCAATGRQRDRRHHSSSDCTIRSQPSLEKISRNARRRRVMNDNVELRAATGNRVECRFNVDPCERRVDACIIESRALCAAAAGCRAPGSEGDRRQGGAGRSCASRCRFLGRSSQENSDEIATPQ